jgi:glutamate synthase domain-containing protein 2
LENILSSLSNYFTISAGLIWALILIAFITVYIIDRTQTKHTIRRNYPVFGRFRWFAEEAGVFIREYFINDERKQDPFSAHDRRYVYASSKNQTRTKAFGTTLEKKDNDFSFVHSQFPYIGNSNYPTEIIFGEDTENPYKTKSRVNVSGMSFGALSANAVLALSKGMKEAGGWLNTGEGGISSYHRKGGADLVFQIGTAKFNVSNNDLTLNEEKLSLVASDPQIKMIELKLSQGAKPGKGGILPASKVNKEIAEARGQEIGTDSISPNRHVEADTLNNLLELIYKTKKYSKKPTGIKLCLGSPEQLDILLKSISEKINISIDDSQNYIPSFITIDSSDGGTGASPSAFLDHMGMHIKESLPLLSEKLIKYNLRDKIKIIASGKLITPANMAWAFAMGADVVVTGRGFLFAQGCIQARKCNTNNCPTGITSHQKKYTKGLVPSVKSKRVANYHRNLTKDLIDIAHACGVESVEFLNSSHIRNSNYGNKIKITNI